MIETCLENNCKKKKYKNKVHTDIYPNQYAWEKK